MTPKQNWLELVIISALFVALSLWGLVWDVTSGLVASGIDGIMLAAVCLLMAVIFAGMLFVQLQQGGILPSFARKQAGSAASANPGQAAKAPSSQKTAAPQTTATAK